MLISQMFPKRFLCADDLQGRDIPVTIRAIGEDKVRRESGDETVYVLFFHKATKGMVLSRRLALQIQDLHGPDTDGWIDKRIVLYPTTLRAFGKTHHVVAVRPFIPPDPNTRVNPSPDDSLDVAEDVVEDIDDVPFDMRPIQSDDPEAIHSHGFPLASGQAGHVQPDGAMAAWTSPLDAQAWAVTIGLVGDADAKRLWVEAVRACQGFDRTKAPQVYAAYIDLVYSAHRENAPLAV